MIKGLQVNSEFVIGYWDKQINLFHKYVDPIMETLLSMFIVVSIIGIYDERLHSLLIRVGHDLLGKCGGWCASCIFFNA